MPVYSSHLVGYSGLGLGTRIRAHRLRQKRTLRQLAEVLSVSEAKLSNVENDKVTLDLGELSRIAAVLGVPISTLLPRSCLSHYLIRRSGEIAAQPPILRQLVGPEPGPQLHHNPVRPLAENFVGKHMEPLFVQIQPLPDNQIHFIAHDHEEFLFVLSGEVEILLKANEELVSEHLRPGDSIYFRSSLPHCTRSTGAGSAECVHVICSLRGAIDSDDAEPGALGHRFYRRGVYEDVVREAAAKIALLRRSHGLTLAQLARDLLVGVRQLAQIESGEKAPDLDLLLRLARRFHRPIEYFFATTLRSDPCYFTQRRVDINVVPIRQRRATDRNAASFAARRYRPMAVGFPDRAIHPYYVQIDTGTAQGPAPHEHHGQEFVYVLEGEIEFVTHVGNVEVVESLRPGDSLFLDSSVPHLLRSSTRNPFATSSAEIVAVFWSPLGEDYLFVDEGEEVRA